MGLLLHGALVRSRRPVSVNANSLNGSGTHLHFSNDICVQHVGTAVTRKGRCFAFPNIYQHLVSPFSLRDKTKPGHRKILVFFLVDPNVKIPSASDVGPQQEAWIRAAVEGTPLWKRLPVELQEIVWGKLGMVTDRQARAYREELMEERTAFVGTVDGQRFGNTFNLWFVALSFLQSGAHMGVVSEH